MTLTTIDAGPGPRTHALVIGIGGYDHLRGGSGQPMKGLLKFGNLGQLTSPPRSALAIVAALKSDALEWQAPLGTIELLVSPAPEDPDPASDGTRFDPPTRDEVQAAFDAWWERCDSDAGNTAFLYVAGHGLQGADQIFLASDFGASSNQPWRTAINMSKTHRALSANRAQTQIVLVDACREVTTSNVENPDPSAPALRDPELRQPDNCLYELTIMATSRTRRAYGPSGKPSYFASAIIAGLNGGAGMKSDGNWWVTSGKLAERLYALMDYAGADTNQQRPIPTASRTMRLARLRSTPPARLQLLCQPDDATGLADLSWRLGAAARQRRPRRAQTPWVIDVAPGLYWVSATFPGGEYQDREQDVIVEPPVTCERIVVT
jgi:Caspase domain